MEPVSRRRARAGANAPLRRPRALPLRRLAAPLLAAALIAGCARGRHEPIAYSRLKERIAAGQVQELRLSGSAMEAVPTAAARKAGAPDSWTASAVPDDRELIPLLDAHHVVYDGPAGTGQPGPLTGILVLLAGGAVLATILVLQRRQARGYPVIGRQRVRDAAGTTATSFEDVAGVDEAKEELHEVVQFLRTPERFVALGARVPRGVLLVGPPGTGKTLLARAVAGEAGVPFYSISASEFVEVFVGVGAARVRKLFQTARSRGRGIVFIDELDAIGKSRVSGVAATNDEREQTLNQLLVEMDGFDAHSGVIVMAATNRAEILDQALLRPGRFDRQVLVDRPDGTGREAILRVHARRIRLQDDVDLTTVAGRTPGFVGADLENLLNEAALLAARAEKAAVSMEELDAAIDRVVAGLEKKNRLVNPKERRIVAFHEAGHAIVAESCPTAEPVRKVSIVPRGAALLGYTQQVPEDRLLMQEDELRDRLAVLLGGRAAEQIVFGQFSTGATNDLERAAGLARRMVCEFGMSTAIGPNSLGSPHDPRLAAGPAHPELSEATSVQVEREVQAILDAAFERACELLHSRRSALDVLSERLLAVGSLGREELLAVLGVAA